MDNTTALQEFERCLRRRFPDRSTPVHYVGDVRQFQRLLGHHDLRTTQRMPTSWTKPLSSSTTLQWRASSNPCRSLQCPWLRSLEHLHPTP